MVKKGIAFFDIDGTLVFHEEAHGIKELGKHADGSVLVYSPATGRRHTAYDASSELYRCFLDAETRELGRRLRETHDVVLVSAARKSALDARCRAIDFSDAAVLESGGVILGPDGQPCEKWAAGLENERAYLKEVADALRENGWVLDDKGRTAAIRVRKSDNLHKTDVEFVYLCKELPLPSALKRTINLGNLDIILASAGKGNAVRYLTGELGYHAPQSHGVGDDENDIDFLNVVGRAYVLGSSYPAALEVARARGWYISHGMHFDGINEILGKIIQSA